MVTLFKCAVLVTTFIAITLIAITFIVITFIVTLFIEAARADLQVSWAQLAHQRCLSANLELVNKRARE